jgi:fructose-bisphosphate aldolase class I
MSDEEATARLDAMNRREPQPWELGFSYGRALQTPVLRAWGGHAANRPAAQAAFRHRAALNGAARKGEYRPEMEEFAEATG